MHISPAMIRIIRMQVAAAILAGLALVLMGQIDHVAALLYGVLLMIGNAWWLAGRLEKTRGLDASAGQRSLYAGAAVRFVALIIGLVVAQLLGLHLLAVAAGMFVAQSMVFVSALREFKDGRGEGIG